VVGAAGMRAVLVAVEKLD